MTFFEAKKTKLMFKLKHNNILTKPIHYFAYHTDLSDITDEDLYSDKWVTMSNEQHLEVVTKEIKWLSRQVRKLMESKDRLDAKEYEEERTAKNKKIKNQNLWEISWPWLLIAGVFILLSIISIIHSRDHWRCENVYPLFYYQS